MLFGALVFAAWRVAFPEMLATVHANIDIALATGDSLSVAEIVIFAEET
jgi:hypothetical protein